MIGTDPCYPLDLDAVAERHGAVIRRLARDKRIGRRSAQRRFVEMLKFLDVCAASEETVSPPPRIDDAWHAFVLFTRDYAAYCEDRFGFFVHHEPMESSDPVAYERAYEGARSRFGELDRRLWPRPRSGGRPGGGGRRWPDWIDGDGGDGGGGGCGGGCGGG